jgi:hypothetical protein
LPKWAKYAMQSRLSESHQAPGHPTAVELDLPGEGERAVTDHAVAFSEEVAAGRKVRSVLENSERHDLRRHPLATDFGKHRVNVRAVDAGLD